MMETIISLIIASGVLGFLANWIVSAAKWLRNTGIQRLNIDPRLIAGVTSLVLAFTQVVAGGDPDTPAIISSLEVIATAGGAWLVAHLTHRANSL